jgi:hypothetical protein
MKLELSLQSVLGRSSAGLFVTCPRPAESMLGTERAGKSSMSGPLEETILSPRDCGYLFGRVGGEALAILRLHDIGRSCGVRKLLVNEVSWNPIRRDLYNGLEKYR